MTMELEGDHRPYEKSNERLKSQRNLESYTELEVTVELDALVYIPREIDILS